ncbi:hypothetical protein J7E73_01515 [Paenibacillus albidus]|uniref:hypothetical protein n=1 Tax=Paenibacillus albidus TaxID=2041023 RepID=UPI001BE55A6C|nr:hypothetical protein [Paenibacillus albidus]MBT2287823.1 hypothetical protein [Paenibacillus albidus]
MMRDPVAKDFDQMEAEQIDTAGPTDKSIVASNAIKYTAYVMLLFGFLYFLAAYLGPML